jgi:hypothetical protein
MNVSGFNSVYSYIESSKESSQADMNKAAHDIARDISSDSEDSKSKRTENHLKYEVAKAEVSAYDLSMRWLKDAINKCERAE